MNPKQKENHIPIRPFLFLFCLPFSLPIYTPFFLSLFYFCLRTHPISDLSVFVDQNELFFSGYILFLAALVIKNNA